MEYKYQVYARDMAFGAASHTVAERKEQIALEQAALRVESEGRLARQRSMDTPPATRIALWESRHGLALPRDPNHPLMSIIAEGTRLDIAQVLAEHQRRALLRSGRTDQ